MNSYENTLERAEEFYDSFNGFEYKGNLGTGKVKLEEFKSGLNEDKIQLRVLHLPINQNTPPAMRIIF
jgi:hypothetical protein